MPVAASVLAMATVLPVEITMLVDELAMRPFVSRTEAVAAYVPAVVGVPEIVTDAEVVFEAVTPGGGVLDSSP